MKHRGYLAYGMLGLPLAMASLPMYVQLPAYYTQQLGIPMAAVGYILFFTRILDTAQDPFIGLLISKFKANNKIWYIVGGMLMASAFAGLWLPPEVVRSHQNLMLAWIALMLFIAYSAHSLLNIAYLSWGAALGQQATGPSSSILLGAATWREGFGLLGVILASIAPTFLLSANQEQRASNLQWYALLFAAILCVAIIALLRYADKPLLGAEKQYVKLIDVIRNRLVRPLFVAYLINSLAVALPASLMVFFVDQHLGANDELPRFLVSYFLAGALGLPLWLLSAKRFGSRHVWQVSLLISILAFIGAAFLSRGDANWYTLICITSGLCLGADLVLPPVLLSEQIGADQPLASYFGVWTFLGKVALATSGLILPLLDYLQTNQVFQNASKGLVDNLALVLCYALIPCALKILTFICLIDSHKRNSP